MIKVENHKVRMFGDLEELSAELTLLMATHYQAMTKHGVKKRQTVARFNGKICSKPSMLLKV